MGRKSKRPSRTSQATPKASSTPTREELALMNTLWPEGWDSSFSLVRVGGRWGHKIQCPHCQAHAPRDIAPHRRWKWMTMHLNTHNRRKAK